MEKRQGLVNSNQAQSSIVTTISTLDSAGIPTTVTTLVPASQSDASTAVSSSGESSVTQGAESSTGSLAATGAAASSSSSFASSSSSLLSSLSSASSAQLPSGTSSSDGSATSSTGAVASKSSGVSTGTVAGAAIGAAIGGLLLGALIMFFVMRKKCRNIRRSNSSRMASMRSSEKSYAQVNTREVELAGAAKGPAWMKDLPQPAADDTLRMNVRTLFHQLELHVENFYADVRPAESSLTPDAMEEIEEFDDRTLPAPILTLMRQASKPTTVIKRALAQHVVSNISVADMKQTSFLPTECTAVTQHRSGGTNKKSGSPEALAQWRVLTAYLRPESQATNTSSSHLTSSENATIRSAAARFSGAFAPWSNPGQSAAAAQNLEAIMRSAAETGMLIFSQPAEFSYAWTEDERQTGRRNAGKLVVTPAVLKVRDENSRLINPASVIVPPGTADL